MVEAIQTNTVNMLGANGHPILSLVKKKFKMKVKTSIKIYSEKTASLRSLMAEKRKVIRYGHNHSTFELPK